MMPFSADVTLIWLGQQALTTGIDMPLWLAAFLAGSFGAVAMSLSMMVVRLAARSAFSMPIIEGAALLPVGTASDKRTLGTAVHLFTGSFLGMLFVAVAPYGALQELPLVTATIIYALVVWLVTGTVLLPVLGRGLMARKTDESAWVILLLGHVVYGIFLGALLPVLYLH